MAPDRTVRDLRLNLDNHGETAKRHLHYPGQERSHAVHFGHNEVCKRDDADLSILAVPRSWRHAGEVRQALLARGEKYAFDLSDYLLQIAVAQRETNDIPQPKGKPSTTGYRNP